MICIIIDPTYHTRNETLQAFLVSIFYHRFPLLSVESLVASPLTLAADSPSPRLKLSLKRDVAQSLTFGRGEM